MKVIYQLNENHVMDLHRLYKREWWSNMRTLKQTQNVLAGSQICIGLVNEHDTLIGFTRVLTDYTFKAFIFDVIISPCSRSLGLGDQLIELVKTHPKLQAVEHFELYCVPEMFQFYQRHGFSGDVGAMSLMRLVHS